MSINVEGHVHGGRPVAAPAQDPQNAPGTGELEPTLTPNQYHLRGGGVSVTWYPGGAGPVVVGEDRTGFVYQDANRSLVVGTEGRSGRRARGSDVVDIATSNGVSYSDAVYGLQVSVATYCDDYAAEASSER